MRILVTGGAGFIGSHLCEALLAAGHEVVVADDLSTGRAANIPDGADLAEVDVTTPEIERLVVEVAPGAVFHLAGQPDFRRSIVDPVFDAEANVLGTVRVATAAARAGTRVLVLASSAVAVYGEQHDFPADEGHPTKPESPYGVSKMCGELYLGMFSRSAGMRAVALRYASVYGPRQGAHGEGGMVATLCADVVAGRPLRIEGDGEQTRDFIHVDDVVRANLAALAATGMRGSYNVATGRETDIVTLARLLGGPDAALEHRPAPAGEPSRSVLDCRRAEMELGWKSEVRLEDGLASTLEWFRAHPAG